MLGRGTVLVADIEQVVGVASLDDVRVDDAESPSGSLGQQAWRAGQRIEVAVDVGVVDDVLPDTLADGEVNHQLTGLVIVHRLGSPDAAHLRPLHVRLVGQQGEVDIGT